jgi:hypothetical protein
MKQQAVRDEYRNVAQTWQLSASSPCMSIAAPTSVSGRSVAAGAQGRAITRWGASPYHGGCILRPRQHKAMCPEG